MHGPARQGLKSLQHIAHKDADGVARHTDYLLSVVTSHCYNLQMLYSQDYVLTLAYLAGIIDGEGHVGVKRSAAYKCQGRATPGYHARVVVKMTDEPAVRLLHQVFGGSFRRERAQMAGRRELWVWQVTDRAAETTLRTLSRFLRVKRRQAFFVLSLRHLQRDGARHRTKVTGYRNFPNSHGTPRTVANRSFSDWYVNRCDFFYKQCRNINGLAGKNAAAQAA